MRTDTVIDRRQVRCPNVSMLGHDKPMAQVGDVKLSDENLILKKS